MDLKSHHHRSWRRRASGIKSNIYVIIIFSALLQVFPYHAHSSGDGLDLGLAWRDGYVLPAGSSSTVTITITNGFTDPLTFRFIGLRFDWMDSGSYLYGGGSEKEHQLAPGYALDFNIAFNVPGGTVAGPHRVYIALIYLVHGEERREVLQIEPSLNVIEVVTVTFTETLITTHYSEGDGGAPRFSSGRPSWVFIAVTVAGGSALILFFAYRKIESRG